MNSNDLAGTQATISLGDVLGAVAGRVEKQFEALLRDLPDQEPEKRPQALLQFVHGARQQLLRSAATIYDTRKFMPAVPLVEQGGVLDVAASHVRSLRQAADELHLAGIQLQMARVPLYNIPDAVDVLATGTYSSFPADILGMERQVADVDNQRLINQLNHMLYSRLLKAKLPDCLRLVQVVDGYAVLRCSGLYEVQLTLDQRLYPAQVEEARHEAAAAAAKQLQEQQQKAKQDAGSSPAAEAAAETEGKDNQAVQQPASAPPQPTQRWVWSLHYAVLLPSAANKPPLQPQQLHQLLIRLKERMDIAVDAAAVEAARQQGKQAAGCNAAGTASQSQQQSGPAAGGASQPSTSGMSMGATSMASGASQTSTAGRVDAGRGLNFKKYAADENTFPLMIMHGILRDVAAQLLLDESTAAAKRLVDAGSRWQGHLRLSRAEVLSPGFRMHYWQKVPVLLAAQPAGVSGSSSRDGPAGLPAIELGVGSDGTVQVLHLPPLRLPGSLQQIPLQFDSHAADIEGLLLQAVAVIASTHLQLLRKAISQAFQKRGLGHFVQLQLSSFDTESTAAAVAGGGDEDSAAVDAAAPSSDTAVTPEAAGAAVAVGMPSSLVVSLDGHALVSVSFQPWSGKIVLRPGSVYGGNRNMEMGIQLQQQQEVLQQKQEQAKQRRSLTEQQAAVQCLQELGLSVADVCADLWMKLQLSSFLAAARRFSLHHTNHTLKGLYQQHVLMLQLPSAAAASARWSTGGSAAGTSAAAGASRVSLASRSGNTLHLAMPSLQLPAYMMLLAAGDWCRDRLGQRGTTAAAIAGAAEVAALAPALCMSFPRRRVPADSRDWLLLMLCDAQGLAGPVLETIRIPVTCFPQPTSAALAALAAAAAAASVDRKRKRDGSGEQQQQKLPSGNANGPASTAAATPEHSQQQEQQRQQSVLLVQPEEHAADIGAAVEWCQHRITFERLLLEMQALQLQVMQVQSLQQVRQQGPVQQPVINLQSVPGVDVFKQLPRRAECSPRSVGVSEVWFTVGPDYGRWSMQLRGNFYHQLPLQQQQQQHGKSGLPGSICSTEGAPQGLQHEAHFQYDLRLGHDVRGAVLQLLRVVRMQQFLHGLELMALGRQRLGVIQVVGGVEWPSGSNTVNSAAAAVEPTAGAAAAAGNVATAADVMDIDDDVPAAKRLKQQQQDGLHHEHLTNGPVPVKGLKQEEQQQSASAVDAPPSNGLLAPAPVVCSNADAYKDSAVNHISNSASSGSPCGLLFHWRDTGLVRVVQYSIDTVVLECGAPLRAEPALPTSAAKVKQEPGQGMSQTQQQQQQQQQQEEGNSQRMRLTFSWQPRFEFSTEPGSKVSCYNFTGGSSSSTTIWVDVPPSMMPGNASAHGWPLARAAQPADVLNMTCSVCCSTPHVSTYLLNELSDMADSGCVDVLLDALACIAWPLAVISGALAPTTAAAAASAGAGRSREWDVRSQDVALPGTGSAVWTLHALRATQRLGVSALSCITLSGVFHNKYRFVLLPHQQQQLQPVAAGSGDQAASPEYSAGVLAAELLFASQGRAKLLVSYEPGSLAVQQSSTAAGTGAGDASEPSAAAATANGTAGAAAATEQLMVDVSAALEGFHRHMTKEADDQRGRIPLLPVLSSGRYLTCLPQPGTLSAREGLAGFWVQNQHLGHVLQQLLLYWHQQVVPEAVRRAAGRGAGAPADTPVAGSGTGPGQQQQQQQPQVKQEPPVQPVVQQQQHRPPQTAVDDAGLVQQQQQQYVQQQQYHSNHMMHQLHQPAAGPVASGL